MQIQRNIEALSLNNCCREEAISIKYYESVCSLSYPACNAHAPYYIVICGLSGSTIFFPHYLINDVILRIIY